MRIAWSYACCSGVMGCGAAAIRAVAAREVASCASLVDGCVASRHIASRLRARRLFFFVVVAREHSAAASPRLTGQLAMRSLAGGTQNVIPRFWRECGGVAEPADAALAQQRRAMAGCIRGCEAGVRSDRRFLHHRQVTRSRRGQRPGLACSALMSATMNFDKRL